LLLGRYFCRWHFSLNYIVEGSGEYQKLIEAERIAEETARDMQKAREGEGQAAPEIKEGQEGQGQAPSVNEIDGDNLAC
jgi:hypothetical protein